MKSKILSIALIIYLSSFGSSLHGENSSPQIEVFGTADIFVTPDTLNWSVLVSSRGVLPSQLATEHDETVAKTISAIQSADVKNSEIQTSSTDLSEKWVYNNSTSYRDGYIATTSITFKSTKAEQYRLLWTKLAQVNGVQIRSSNWELSNAPTFRAKARSKAIAAAIEKAELMAKDAGVRLLEPISITEIQEPLYRAPGNRSSNVISYEGGGEDPDSSSVSAGVIKITARVSMSFRIGSK